jgi:hypothetical protein
MISYLKQSRTTRVLENIAFCLALFLLIPPAPSGVEDARSLSMKCIGTACALMIASRMLAVLSGYDGLPGAVVKCVAFGCLAFGLQHSLALYVSLIRTST